MIVLGVVLLVIGFLFAVPIIWTLGVLREVFGEYREPLAV